VWRGRAMDKA